MLSRRKRQITPCTNVYSGYMSECEKAYSYYTIVTSSVVLVCLLLIQLLYYNIKLLKHITRLEDVISCILDSDTNVYLTYPCVQIHLYALDLYMFCI